MFSPLTLLTRVLLSKNYFSPSFFKAASLALALSSDNNLALLLVFFSMLITASSSRDFENERKNPLE